MGLSFSEKKRKLIKEFNAVKGTVSLKKSTSNLFRTREIKNKKIDVKNFNSVISVDLKTMLVDVEGMTTYEILVDETLKHGCMPTVVPQLKTITIGGAVSGLGIESSSFRYGLVHETVEEMEILTGTGRIVLCTRTNENKDLFFGFPNSYGTLGYILRLKVRLVKVTPYIQLTHQRFTDSVPYFAAVQESCVLGQEGNKKDAIDFVDGTVFSKDEMYLTTAHFIDRLPKGCKVSNYTYMDIYYKSIRKKTIDYLTTRDYIWRWDTDWFWCSKNFGVQNPLLRIFVKPLLNSRSYWKMMHFFSRTKMLERKNKVLKIKVESVIQDVEIPIGHAPKFLSFFQKEICISPVWICPTQAYSKKVIFDLYKMDPKVLYINFGFWDVVKTDHEQGYLNKRVEHIVENLDGKKSLYSTVHYTEKKFWQLYNRKKYKALKNKYDPKGRFKNLYEKTVLRK